MKQVLTALAVIFIAFLISCEEKVVEPVFTFDNDTLKFTSDGGNATLTVNMNGERWTVTPDQTWCTASVKYSYDPETQLTITVAANTTKVDRTARLKFNMDSKYSYYVTIKQDKFIVIYPDYSDPITPDPTGMESSAVSIASNIYAGWNLGNSLEAPGGEISWGNPPITQRLIDSIKQSGFNAIRLPCAWNSHLSDAGTCKIKDSWLTRVKEVVDYCYNNEMYVIINIHWDGGWLEENPTFAMQEDVNKKQKAFWEQIAVYFRNYDEHLLFAGTNEVHTSTNPVPENYVVQLSYNQTFVDAVRSTGGRNTYRTLIVQAYYTDINRAVSKLVMSDDATADRLMAEVHYYDPWEFAGLEANADWGTVKTLWGSDYAQYGVISSWGQESWVLEQFQKMKTSFVDEGYPVILGEYGAIRRSLLTGTALEHHLDSRAYYFRYITQQAKNFGMVPFYWDNGATGNLGFGLFNRDDGSVFDRQALDSLLAGASAGAYPF